MKANLIINLVTAHSSGNESQFESALSDLIHDEEKKGNAQLALSLKNAYSPDKHFQSSMISPMSTMSFSVQSVTNLPKDKDSTLDLVEILQPTVQLKDVALSEDVYKRQALSSAFILARLNSIYPRKNG